MELSSGRCRRSSQTQQSGNGRDRISALSNDMLHLILGRLGSARDAVRTTALSRRWRGLFPRREIVFRDVAFSSLEAELGSICLCHPCTKVYRIKTCVHGGCIPDEHAVQSLINAANRLTPQQYSLVLPSSGICKGANLLDGCFHNQQPGFIRATCYVYLRPGLMHGSQNCPST